MNKQQEKNVSLFGIFICLMMIAGIVSAAGRQFTSIRNAAISVDSTIGGGDSLVGGFFQVYSDSLEIEGENINPTTGADFRSLNGAIILGASSTTTAGFGLSDSGVIYLVTHGLGYAPAIIDSVRSAIPCTLLVGLANAADTTFKRKLSVYVFAYDTSAATGLAPSPYQLSWELIGRD